MAIRRLLPPAHLADPFPRDGNPDVARADTPNFVGRFAVALRLHVLVHDVGPSPRADVGSGAADDTREVGLALHQSDREAVHGEDVQRLERHRVVAAQHVLVTQQVGEIRRERVTDARVFGVGNQTATQLQTEELARIEHLPVARIPPAVQPVGLVAGRNGLVGHEARRELLPSPGRFVGAGQILGVGLLEETSLVLRLAVRVVVLDGEQAVSEWTVGVSRIGIVMSAVRALATPPACRSGPLKRARAGHAAPGPFAVLDLVEVAARGADQDILRVAPVLGEQVARKQIDGVPTGFAVEHLDPQKGLHGDVRVAVARAGGPVVPIDLGAERVDERPGGPLVDRQVDMLDLLADDPRRHRVDVEPIHVASDAIRLDERRSPSHERIGNPQSRKVVRPKEQVFQRTLAELREKETTKQGSWAAGEPLVNADDRAVVLLDLLLSKCHCGNQRDVEPPLDAHRCFPSFESIRCAPAAGTRGMGPTRIVHSWAGSVPMT